jgi:hypothetical protein
MNEGSSNEAWLCVDKEVFNAWCSIGSSLSLSSNSQIATFLIDRYTKLPTCLRLVRLRLTLAEQEKYKHKHYYLSCQAKQWQLIIFTRVRAAGRAAVRASCYCFSETVKDISMKLGWQIGRGEDLPERFLQIFWYLKCQGHSGHICSEPWTFIWKKRVTPCWW